MPDLSLRGLDAAVLARIKSDARRSKTSVNRTIIELLTRHFGRSGAQYNDLDALAGTWSKAEAAEFDEAIAPFGKVDQALWVAEPKARYQAGAAASAKAKPRRARK